MELWIGDAAQIKSKRVRKQKTDWEDARLLLRLLRENNFPRIWVPSPENRDLRQLLWHRLVQMRTRIMHCAYSQPFRHIQYNRTPSLRAMPTLAMFLCRRTARRI
jgi:hypothetical protein